MWNVIKLDIDMGRKMYPKKIRNLVEQLDVSVGYIVVDNNNNLFMYDRKESLSILSQMLSIRIYTMIQISMIMVLVKLQ